MQEALMPRRPWMAESGPAAIKDRAKANRGWKPLLRDRGVAIALLERALRPLPGAPKREEQDPKHGGTVDQY